MKLNKRYILLFGAIFLIVGLWSSGSFEATEETVTITKTPEVSTTPKITNAPKITDKYKKRITLKVKNADLPSLLRTLADQTGRNIAITGKITGTVTVDLTDVYVDDAIRAILRTSDLGAEYHKDLIIVRPLEDTEEAKVFTLQYIDGASVLEGLEEFLSDKGKISYDSDTNSLMVRDTTDAVRNIAMMVKEIDRTPRQVLVEAAIVEVKLEDDTKSAMQFLYADSHHQIGTNKLPGTEILGNASDGLFFKVFASKITSILEVLQERTKTNILAHPKVLALNGKEAEILIGKETAYKTTTQLNTGATQESVEWLESGTRLLFTPHITENGEILMEIHPEVSTETLRTVGNEQLPDKTSTEATTSISVIDGQTIVLGGLISEEIINTDTGIPILQDIPLLGLLFKRKTVDTEKREIVILITPHIINEEDKEAMKEEILRARKTYNLQENKNFTGFKKKSKKEFPEHKNPKGPMSGFGERII
ncbi:type II secretion system protein GspD [Bdellovibrionota bacterium]